MESGESGENGENVESGESGENGENDENINNKSEIQNNIQLEDTDNDNLQLEENNNNTNVEIVINKANDTNKKYIVMGLSTEENAFKVMNYLSNSVNGYIPSITTIENISDYLNSNINKGFRISNDSILTQRLSIYVQLYRKSGLFINPAVHRELQPTFETYVNNSEANIFFLLDKIKNKEKRNTTAKKHGIRQGKPERELHVSAHFMYSKKPNHPFWKDLLLLYQKRYNQTVPNGERIESISNYGRSYLSGSDLLSENIHKCIEKYEDIVILNPNEYLKFVSKAENKI